MSDTRHHRIDYVEITTPDLDAAKAFYGSAFGWTFTDYGPDYAGFRTPADADPDAPEAGGLARGEARGAGGPFVMFYSDDLDATAAAVVAAGGAVVDGPYAFPGGRRFHFTDPGGTELGVWASA